MDTLSIWTDGACSKNGQRGAKAGYGVYFGVGDARNISKPLGGATQTNQRAEMAAMLAALRSQTRARIDMGRAAVAAAPPLAVTLLSDSRYVLKGLTEWMSGWRRRGWMNAAGKPIANKDLWLQLDRAYAALRGMPRVTVTLQHVKGHSGDVGNDGADALAVAGAQRAAVGGEIGSMDDGSSSSRGSRAAATSTASQPPAKKRRTTTTTIASSSKRCYNYAIANGRDGFTGVVSSWDAAAYFWGGRCEAQEVQKRCGSSSVLSGSPHHAPAALLVAS